MLLRANALTANLPIGVEVCPVACFYEMDNQVVIHPEDCMIATACVAECPVEAIYAERDVPADFQVNTEFNATESHG